MASNSSDKSNLEISGMTFENALEKLDETVQSLEDGDLPLSEALRLFEEGMKLAKVCSETLATAELKITHIQKSYDEQLQFEQNDLDEPLIQ
ncbi:MAG: exodeoxyribonuclease VII small subunit [SAR202 cluster bacterium]|jgi:exodeoxyribonuclease VII small subunit|nr:exodeoxyribonuclease VII small subunit [SAR202 cluster bacterium]